MGVDDDIRWMRLALQHAELAAHRGEVPVGAVLVRDEQLLAAGANAQVGSADPTAHAEVVALRAAAKLTRNYRLTGSTLYVTLEPCTMCAGALVHARVARVVFATAEPRSGAVCSTAQVLANPGLNHRVQVTQGVLEEASATLLKSFFAARRAPGSTAVAEPNDATAQSAAGSDMPLRRV